MKFARSYVDSDDPPEYDPLDDIQVRFLPPDGRREWSPVDQWQDADWRHWLGQHDGWDAARIDQYLLNDRYTYGVGFQRHLKEPVTYFYLPVPAAVPLHSSKVPNVLYGGAAGGTKSHSTRWDAYRHLLTIPDYSSILMRRTHGELQRNHTNKAIGECARINDFFQRTVFDLTPSQHMMRVPETRGLLTFGHCQNAGDEETYLGDEYDEFRPDELATFLEQQIVGVAGRLRSVKHGDYGKLRARLIGTTNPGGANTRWIKDWWIDKNITADKNPRYRPDDYFFIGARLYDNPFLMDLDGTYSQYEDRLFAHSKMRRRQLLNGDWSVITGQFFDEWEDARMVGVLAIPEGCKIECWIDWGYDPNPGVCHWVACFPNGRLYVFAEWVFRRTIAGKVAKRIAEMTLTEVCTPKTRLRWNRTIGDPSMWAKDGHTGESYQETFRRNGVHMMKSDNDRVQGWGRLRHWYSKHPEGGSWLMYHPDCVYAIRTIPSLVHDDNDPDDLDTGGDDHAADADRYGVMARPTPTTSRFRTLPTMPDSLRHLVNAELLKQYAPNVRPFGKVC